MARIFVYGLIDPRTLLIRYVGKTATGMWRPKAHREPKIRGRNTHCAAWVRSLLAQGLDYEVCILEVCTRASLDESERWWIAMGRMSGWDLTNLTDGGDGTTGHKMTDATCAKMSARMRAEMASPEARARVSAAHKGKVVSVEVRERMAAAQRGKHHSPETIEKLRALKVGRKATAETRAKMSAAHMGNPSRTGQKISDEQKRKLSVFNRGRKQTPETIQRMRDAALAREQRKRLARKPVT